MATIVKRILGRMDEIVKQQKPGNGVAQEDFDKLKASVGEIQQLVGSNNPWNVNVKIASSLLNDES